MTEPTEWIGEGQARLQWSQKFILPLPSTLLQFYFDFQKARQKCSILLNISRTGIRLHIDQLINPQLGVEHFWIDNTNFNCSDYGWSFICNICFIELWLLSPRCLLSKERISLFWSDTRILNGRYLQTVTVGVTEHPSESCSGVCFITGFNLPKSLLQRM